jgi:predicted enzyme related to lactoylglutathione lyase
MPGQIVHFEIPADDTTKGREFWGSLFGWNFQAMPGPFEYHMTQVSDQTGGAITDMEPGKHGMRVYFDVEDIGRGAAGEGAWRGEPTTPAPGTGQGLVLHLQGPARQRLRPLAERPVRFGAICLMPFSPDPGVDVGKEA